MTRSDRDLARRVREMHVPEHEDGFWDRVDEHLDQISFDTTKLADDPRSVEDPAIEPAPAPTLLSVGAAREAARRPGRLRHRTLLLAVAATIAIIAAATGVLLSQGDDDQQVDTVDEPTPTTERSPETTFTTPTTVATTVAPSTTVAPPVEPEPTVTFAVPRDAAVALYDAWRAGSRAAAAPAASPEAIDALFTRAWADVWGGSECEQGTGDRVDCYWGGDGEALVIQVLPDVSTGYRVSAVEFRYVPKSSYYPYVFPTPFGASVGATVQLDGDGFVGEAYIPDAPLWLVRESDGCALYAEAEHQVQVDGDGHLVGELVVPATGECRFSDGAAEPVTPGRYQIAYGSTANFVGEIQVL